VTRPHIKPLREPLRKPLINLLRIGICYMLTYLDIFPG
jgi:hypothetical protein